jgi:exodeoxyribonuclease-1
MPTSPSRHEPSLYWYDYETFGADPRRDRPAQFAGIRTDLDLNIIGEPLTLYCRPADDFLPHPEACLITGITPQVAREKGVPEAEFIARIHEQFARPNTCIVGYNNIRFDDEVTRFTLYRNFFDPYGHEWQNGNSRWDIIDMVRLTYALRPEGINWPKYDDGKPSFRLDQLTVANNIAHEAAHDALSDVHATIAMARLIRDRQPRLYDYVFSHRSKQAVAQMLNLAHPRPVLHVSSMYPSELGCIAPVMPLAAHPGNKNEIIVYDLRSNPGPFLSLDAREIRERLFTRQQDLPDGCERIPVKTVHINKSPVIVPVNTLDSEAAEKWQIDLQDAQQNLSQLLAVPQFAQNIRTAFGDREFATITDPDFMLYSGGFFSNDDRARIEMVRTTPVEMLHTVSPVFDDSRLSEMLLRYRARNYPQTLNEEEQQYWREFRKQRLLGESGVMGLSVSEFRQVLSEKRQQESLTERELELLKDLESYASNLLVDLQ